MTLSEKSAYLKGLMEGLRLDTEKAEGKLIAGIIDTLSDIALSVDDLEETVDTISEELDYVEDSLDEIEEFLGEDCCCDEEDEYADETLYEITCPKCNEVITLDEEMLDEGSISCPKCGETLEYDADSVE